MLLDLPISTSKNSGGSFQKGSSRRHRGKLSRPEHGVDQEQLACAERRIIETIRRHTSKGIVHGQSPKEAVRFLAKHVNNTDHALGGKKWYFSVLRNAFTSLLRKRQIEWHKEEGYFQLVLS